MALSAQPAMPHINGNGDGDGDGDSDEDSSIRVSLRPAKRKKFPSGYYGAGVVHFDKDGHILAGGPSAVSSGAKRGRKRHKASPPRSSPRIHEPQTPSLAPNNETSAHPRHTPASAPRRSVSPHSPRIERRVHASEDEEEAADAEEEATSARAPRTIRTTSPPAVERAADTATCASALPSAPRSTELDAPPLAPDAPATVIPRAAPNGTPAVPATEPANPPHGPDIDTADDDKRYVQLGKRLSRFWELKELRKAAEREVERASEVLRRTANEIALLEEQIAQLKKHETLAKTAAEGSGETMLALESQIKQCRDELELD